MKSNMIDDACNIDSLDDERKTYYTDSCIYCHSSPFWSWGEDAELGNPDIVRFDIHVPENEPVHFLENYKMHIGADLDETHCHSTVLLPPGRFEVIRVIDASSLCLVDSTG